MSSRLASHSSPPPTGRSRMLRELLHRAPDTGIGEGVRARMKRRQALHEPGRRFHLVVREAALRALICPPEVMLGRLWVPGSIIPYGCNSSIFPGAAVSSLADGGGASPRSGFATTRTGSCGRSACAGSVPAAHATAP
ncbi:Scr1 family TA system antitoxin-like transcriptional regulator [Streptomyces sp. NPDC020883]|uniref:Scr1 family TA system antitoxin-like transcriptional regulator n=1 Tax=Streptomyces sp. NPDC020883 TaxID=3365099 RepID=UPI0037B079EE